MAVSGFNSSNYFTRKTERRTIVLGVLVFLMLLFLSTTAQAQFAGGDGSSGNPYQIDNAEGLNEIRNHLGAHYILVADIDLTTATGESSGAYWNSGKGWQPIGDFDNPFTGTFDGGGFTITGLFINWSVGSHLGLFGETASGSEITNVGLVKVNITTGAFSGGLAGENNGTITGSYTTGSVSGITNRIGGLVGANRGTISESFTTCSVTGGSRVGGLVGENQDTITNSYTTGDVTGSNNLVGGLAGINIDSITDSYATGKVDGDDDVGGLVGDNLGDITTSYWNTETSGLVNAVGDGDDSGTTGLTDEQMRQQASFSGFDFTDTWQIDEGIAFPVLQNNEQVPPPGFVPEIDSPADGAIKISLIPTLQWDDSYGIGSYDVQVSIDSDFTTIVEDETGITDTEYTPSNELSVGTMYYWRVRATEDFGQTYWVSAQFRTVPSPNGDGTEATPWEIATAEQLNAVRYYLVDHYIQTADINLTTATGDPSGAYWNDGEGWEPIGEISDGFTGSLDGNGYMITGLTINNTSSEAGLFSEISSEGRTLNVTLINVDISGTFNVGALAGRSTGFIENSSATGSVSGTLNVGGLVGEHSDTGVIMNSFANVKVTGTDIHVGGLVGFCRWGGSTVIEKSYATGDVTGNMYVGGLGGLTTDVTIKESYATGNVRATGYGYAGGLVGAENNEAVSGGEVTIIDSYATGNVTANNYTGGLMGELAGFYTSVENSYATGLVTGNSHTGGLMGYMRFEDPVITNSFWNTETSGTTTAVGNRSPSGVTGLTTAQMRQQTSFTGWDFTDTWQIESGTYSSYPYLQEITYDEPGTEPEVNPIPGLFSISPNENNILFVDQNVDGGDGSGESWANAIPELRDALAWAGENWDGDTDGTLQIWVAEGIYIPTGDGSTRTATFQLLNNVEIFGGFDPDNGIISLEDERILTPQGGTVGGGSILSGDIDGNDNLFAPDTDSDNYSETLSQTDHIQGTNSYHVVTGSGTDNTALLDGFTITAGNTYNASDPHQNGGGIFNENGNPTLKNLVIEGNRALLVGGGIFSTENSSLTLNNVVLAHNTALIGGGMAIDNSRSTLVNVRMESNSAYSDGGAVSGGLNGTLLIINALFVDNSALGSGGAGALSIGNSDATLINATFVNNSAENGKGGAIFSNGDMRIVNSIFWENTAEDEANDFFNGEDATADITNSIFNSDDSDDVVSAGTLICNSCSDLDPIFADPDNRDFTLASNSPAINAGTNTPYGSNGDAEGVTTDLAGNDRTFGDIVDIGAYEFQDEPLLPPDPIVLTSPEDEAVNVSLTPELIWEADETADLYRIEISENDDLTDPLIDEGDLENSSFELTSDLNYLTTYYWRVRGLNNVGSGETSEIFSFTTLPESSDVVILTDPSDEQDDIPLQPLFEWNSADGADTYDLVVSPNSDLSDPVIEQTDITETEFQATEDLDFLTTYYWKVRGVNAGGPGQWSESFSFTTLDKPEAGDNRILVANSESYTFTPADFGQDDNSFSVVIEDLSGGLTGTFELDGNTVNSDDEISIGDIDNGDLIYTPPADMYGYGYDSFKFSIEDAGGNPSDESYTMSLDLGATSVDLSYDREGWRFLSSPVDGETVGEFFAPIWTQGFPGSDSPGADFANIQTLNQQEYVWEPVESDDAGLNAGDAVIAYVYGDDDNNGSDDGFPKTLSSSTDNWIALDGSYEESFFYDPDQQDTDNSFFLWGNPHPVAIDLCEADLQDIPKNAYFWDQAANSGNGNYVNLSCDGGDDVEIAPYQSVWLRLTDANNSMELPSGTYMEGTTDGYFKETQPSSDNFIVSLTVRSEGLQEESFINTTRILFHDDASAGSDLIDAPKLSSAGLAQNYLSLYSLDEENNPYALQALPTAMDEKTRIPLDIQTTESGQFTMEWNLPEPHVFNGSYFLRDNETGEVIELKEGSEYSFEIESTQTSKDSESLQVSGEQRSAKFLGNFADLGDDFTARFELLIASSGIDGLSELGATPEDFTLAQNYPNPFNPTTVISYQLPVSSEVRLEVYDMLGRNVATLVNSQVSAGRHTVNFDASNLSSGVYLYRLQAGSQIMTKKLTILK